MRSTFVTFLIAAATVFPGCTDNGSAVGPDAGAGPDGGAATTGACARAGGRCVLGDVTCGARAPAGAQDCTTDPPNPGGGFCCLADADADVGPPADSGKPACVAAGGACVGADASACPAGSRLDDATYSCAGSDGASCCLTDPADGGGRDAATTCSAVGGKCIALGPTSCAGGTVLDQTTYPCGTGLGVECCLPPSGDAGGPGAFACGGALTCDGRVQVCHVLEGGAVKPDGGVNVSYSCQSIPAACAANVTCACIQPATGTQLCAASNGDVTVTTEAP